MIFGKTTKDVQQAKVDKINDILNNGIRRFAFWPVKLANGQYLFLEYYRSVLFCMPNRRATFSILMKRKNLRTILKEYSFTNYSERDILVKKLQEPAVVHKFTINDIY